MDKDPRCKGDHDASECGYRTVGCFFFLERTRSRYGNEVHRGKPTLCGLRAVYRVADDTPVTCEKC